MGVDRNRVWGAGATKARAAQIHMRHAVAYLRFYAGISPVAPRLAGQTLPDAIDDVEVPLHAVAGFAPPMHCS